MLKLRGDGNQARENRLKKLAAAIDALVDKDEEEIRRARMIAETRLRGAAQLHSVCAEFASSLNRILSRMKVELEPEAFTPEAFRDPGANILQLNARGRVIQIEYHATEGLTSTEDFRVPYILYGAVRSFNQDSLDRIDVHEHLLFFCVEDRMYGWHYFDPRTYRAGPLNRDYLIGVMERLV